MKVCPLVRDIIGRVVSPVVAPPTLMGANGPKNCRNSGAQSKFPQDIIDKGNGTHFRVACLRDEDARQGIVTESGTDG